MRRKSRRSPFRASIDHLEDRRVLSSWGNPWPDPTHLSLSFAPDGTSDAGQSSALFQTLESAGSTSAWQSTILRAYQTWASYANISIGIKADGAEPFGTPGPTQGDARFGDIRIGAIAQAPGVLAVTEPFSYEGGSWAGDMNINTADILSLGGSSGSEDLFTLALHEAGHSFGLPDNSDPSSIMYSGYLGPRTGLAPEDIAAIQGLYGPRPADTEYDANFYSPSWLSVASPDGSNINSSSVLANDSIATTSDQHNYAFLASTSGTCDIDLTTAGFSSLLGKITAYDSRNDAIGSTVATDPTSGNLILSLNLSAWNFYHFTISSGSNSVFGVGNYSLRVLPSSLNVSAATVNPDTYTGRLVDAGANDGTLATATNLAPRATSLDSILYAAHGSVSPVAPADDYKFVAAPSGQGVMTVSVADLDATGLKPSVSITDPSGNPVASQVIVSEPGRMVLQVANDSPLSTYAVKVTSGVTSGPGSSGNYALSVGFGKVTEYQAQVGSGTLTPTGGGSSTTWSTQSSPSLTTAVDGLVHLGLGVNTGGIDQDTFVQLAIVDESGHVVTTLDVKANRAGSLEIWLAAGTYTLRITGIDSGASAPVPMQWSLGWSPLCDPMLSIGYTGGGSSTTTYPPGQKAPPPPPPLLG